MPHKLIKALTTGFTLLGLLTLGVGGFYLYRMSLRPARQATSQALFQGVTYQRHVRNQPRPLVYHVITVDLSAPGIDFLVTPASPTAGYPLAADTVPGFLKRHGVQVAINGSFFAPHEVSSPLTYYPHVGDGVQSMGIAVSNSTLYSEAKEGWAALCILSPQDIRITQNACPRETQQAIAGDIQFVKDGKPYDGLAILKHSERVMPRSAIAVNADNTKLWLVDGRQSGYSEGMTIRELSHLMVELGADRALNFDGGGSTTLATADADARPQVLNAPIQARIPMNLRPVANHLGLYAQPLSSTQAQNQSETLPSSQTFSH